jgi:hypothetical protein
MMFLALRPRVRLSQKSTSTITAATIINIGAALGTSGAWGVSPSRSGSPSEAA